TGSASSIDDEATASPAQVPMSYGITSLPCRDVFDQTDQGRQSDVADDAGRHPAFGVDDQGGRDRTRRKVAVLEEFGSGRIEDRRIVQPERPGERSGRGRVEVTGVDADELGYLGGPFLRLDQVGGLLAARIAPRAPH